MDELPTDFELIVIGTGVVESAISAAASRIGKQVLHIDNNDYYGGPWASFSLEQINNLALKPYNAANTNNSESLLKEDEYIKPVCNGVFCIQNVTQKWHIPEKEVVEVLDVVEPSGDVGEKVESTQPKSAESKEMATKVFTQEILMKSSRKFNIDLAPKLNFSRGEFVELMISSNIARYTEFRSVSRVLTYINGKVELVPCSRSDVFCNDNVSVFEKRMLMKLLTSCMDDDAKEFKGYENKTFSEYLKDKKVSEQLRHFILYALSMSDEHTSCSDGVKNTKRFIDSLGRFGKTPFLYSMYGSGEIPQAFCRLSAVFGGIYALNKPTMGVIFDKEKNYKGVVCGSQRIDAKRLVLGIDKVPNDFVEHISSSNISRAVFITDRSIMDSEKEHLSLLFYPSEQDKPPCTIIELGTLTGTCPKDTYLVHIFTKGQTDPQADLKQCVEKLFSFENEEDSRPKVLWSLYYSVPNTNDSELSTGIPENMWVCPGPDMDLDYDVSMKKARDIFKDIYPDGEFLPRAPDPEEIIFGEEDNVDQPPEVPISQNEEAKPIKSEETGTN